MTQQRKPCNDGWSTSLRRQPSLVVSSRQRGPGMAEEGRALLAEQVAQVRREYAVRGEAE